jgi:hypothetical protein
MGKTERILSNLPPTFRPYPRPSALFALANAVGLPLQEGENLLVEVMKAHWVDYADLSREAVRDLAYLADLYDLDPRPDESVEEFREHLKRYVLTFLQGTATVRGILRVAADTLGLVIDDEALRHPRQRWEIAQDGAACLLFGVPWMQARGQDARPARVIGQADLSGGVDLEGYALRLASGGIEQMVVGKSGTTSLSQIVQQINDAFGVALATHDGLHLVLFAAESGAASEIALRAPDGPDAADPLLGVAPRTYRGTTRARPGR